MSLQSLRFSPTIQFLKSDASSLRFLPTSSALPFSTNSICNKSIAFACAIRPRGAADLAASRDEGDLPVSVDLDPICSDDQFDRLLADAQLREELVIVVWIASWCRKCIYLKPKLEKLAADYYPRLRFYCVDVNAVPHKLISRAGVTKMPTIQLWKDSKKQSEIIGGHKAYLVVNEVREMIENELIAS
ncbi:unnamed protein product [Rhodiola kirilowii]